MPEKPHFYEPKGAPVSMQQEHTASHVESANRTALRNFIIQSYTLLEI